jgi:hypothetical protein
VRAAANRGRSWTLTVDHLGRPTTTNKAHNMHHRAVSTDRKRWREAGCVLARAAGIPALGRIEVEAWGRYPDRRSLPDPDGIAPALKGVLDGLVDACVVPDDSGVFVAAVTYRAPLVLAGLAPALIVSVREVDS